MNQQRLFSTQHWNLAAFLCFMGYKLVSTNLVTSYHYLFCFDDRNRTAKADADRFFSAEGIKVDARGVLEAGKYLRRAAKETKIRMGVTIR